MARFLGMSLLAVFMGACTQSGSQPDPWVVEGVIPFDGELKYRK